MMYRLLLVVGVALFGFALNAAAQAEKAPETYKVKFDTSKGPFVVEVHRTWAPIGAEELSRGRAPGPFRNAMHGRACLGRRSAPRL